MAQTSSKQKRDPFATNEPPTSFDVVSVIGTVQLDKHGTENPDLAAFRIIAEHGSPGEFTFPNVYGAETRVNVEGQPPAPSVEGDGYGS